MGTFPSLTSAVSGNFFVDLEPDILTGGPGDDRFVFRAPVGGGVATLLGPDEITDFEGAGLASGDVIDVSAIDSDGLLALGDQAFMFATGPGIGHLWVEDSGADARVLMDTNGGLPDFEILLRNIDHGVLRAEDIVL
jgi:Ca2+-binding RTX toxin-like protein